MWFLPHRVKERKIYSSNKYKFIMKLRMIHTFFFKILIFIFLIEVTEIKLNMDIIYYHIHKI